MVPYKEWTADDDMELTKLKESDIDIKDTTLCRLEESKKLDMKAILSRMSKEERSCLFEEVSRGDISQSCL